MIAFIFTITDARRWTCRSSWNSMPITLISLKCVVWNARAAAAAAQCGLMAMRLGFPMRVWTGSSAGHQSFSILRLQNCSSRGRTTRSGLGPERTPSTVSRLNVSLRTTFLVQHKQTNLLRDSITTARLRR